MTIFHVNLSPFTFLLHLFRFCASSLKSREGKCCYTYMSVFLSCKQVFAQTRRQSWTNIVCATKQYVFLYYSVLHLRHGCVVVVEFDSRSRGHGVLLPPICHHMTTLDKSFTHSHRPTHAFITKQHINMVTGRWCFAAAVTLATCYRLSKLNE